MKTLFRLTRPIYEIMDTLAVIVSVQFVLSGAINNFDVVVSPESVYLPLHCLFFPNSLFPVSNSGGSLPNVI